MWKRGSVVDDLRVHRLRAGRVPGLPHRGVVEVSPDEFVEWHSSAVGVDSEAESLPRDSPNTIAPRASGCCTAPTPTAREPFAPPGWLPWRRCQAAGAGQHFGDGLSIHFRASRLGCRQRDLPDGESYAGN